MGILVPLHWKNWIRSPPCKDFMAKTANILMETCLFDASRSDVMFRTPAPTDGTTGSLKQKAWSNWILEGTVMSWGWFGWRMINPRHTTNSHSFEWTTCQQNTWESTISIEGVRAWDRSGVISHGVTVSHWHLGSLLPKGFFQNQFFLTWFLYILHRYAPLLFRLFAPKDPLIPQPLPPRLQLQDGSKSRFHP